jgi:anti-sigma regulatory factor (Ser/Thr protein kinase)
MPDSLNWETAILNRLGNLMAALNELDACLERWGADASARYLARFAVEELGTNTIKYGYDDQEEHTILLRAAREKSNFRICLEDDGHEFNPCLTPEPDPNLDLQKRTPGGWGLSLLRRLSAGVLYERRADRNHICVLVPRAGSDATTA